MASESPRSKAPPAGVDLHRREDRYLVHPGDIPELVARIAHELTAIEYPNTPVTRTVYFGDETFGVPLGLSVKGRSYREKRTEGPWVVSSADVFDVLEFKRTVRGRDTKQVELPRFKLLRTLFPVRFQEVWELLSLAGESLARRDKEKQRTDRIPYGDAVAFLRSPLAWRVRLSDSLDEFLAAYRELFAHTSWQPLVGTEYRRRHFVAREPGGAERLRATLDEDITCYDFRRDGDAFVGRPLGEDEFARIEIKIGSIDPDDPALERLQKLLRDYLVFPVPSKKYRSLTLRSERQIELCELENELPLHLLEALVPIRGMRFSDHDQYPRLLESLRTSGTLVPRDDPPRLHDQRMVEIEGRHEQRALRITPHELLFVPPDRIEKLRSSRIVLRELEPSSRRTIESHRDLEPLKAIVLTDAHSEDRRARGFLATHPKSGRVYLVSLCRIRSGRRKTRGFLSIRYLGRNESQRAAEPIGTLRDELAHLARSFASHWGQQR